jgi:hypothetical protein
VIRAGSSPRCDFRPGPAGYWPEPDDEPDCEVSDGDPLSGVLEPELLVPELLVPELFVPD